VRVEGNRSIDTLGLDFSEETVDHAGNSSTWACPDSTSFWRVLSLGVSVQVTLLRYGLPFSQ
jgi:hypothetical protein